jgi:O-antigen/teichoic acid export membrane protein
MKAKLSGLLAGSRIRYLLLSVAPIVLPLATGTIMHLLMARSIAPADYSLIPKALALASFATVIAYFVNHDVAAREVAISPVRTEAVRAFFVGRAAMTLAGLLIGAGVAHVLHREDYLTILVFLLWFAVSTGLVENLIQSWRANDGYGKSALLAVIQFLLLSAGIAFLYFLGATPRRLAMVLTAASFLAAILALPMAGALFGRFDRRLMVKMLARSLPVAASGLAVFVSNWFGVFWLSFAGGREDLTHYFLAGKFAGAHLIAISVLYFAFIPELSGMDKERVRSIFRRWLWAIAAFALASFLAVYYVILPAIGSFWGPGYLEVRHYYALYLPWVIIACLSYYCGIFVFASGYSAVIGIFQSVLAILTVGLTMLAYNEWGPLSLPLAEGAAVLAAGMIQYGLWSHVIKRGEAT